jgi:O-antigen/teichoic acid export membrane protein
MQAVFQARQKFGTLSVLRISEGGGKLLFILVFLAAGSFSLDVVFIAYVLVPGLVGIVGVFLARQLWVRMRDDWRVIGREIFGFGKWMMLSSFATMLLMRLDIFVLGAMLHDRPDEIGLYSAAVRLCTPLIVLTGSVATLFLPKALGLRSMAEMRSYIRRSLQVTLPLVAICGVYAVVVWLAIPAYFPKYTNAIPYFLLLFVGYAWTIVGNPLTTLVLSINRAHVVTIISIAQLVFSTASHYIFIGWMGAMGAAVSTVLMWFLAGGVSLWYLYVHRHEIETAPGGNVS